MVVSIFNVKIIIIIITTIKRVFEVHTYIPRKNTHSIRQTTVNVTIDGHSRRIIKSIVMLD